MERLLSLRAAAASDAGGARPAESGILQSALRTITMNELLADVIEAHGGLDHWRSVNLGEATIVTGGGLWGLKGVIQDPNPRRMTVSLHEERASVKPFGDPDWYTEFTPERIAIVRSDGSVVKERMHPKRLLPATACTRPGTRCTRPTSM